MQVAVTDNPGCGATQYACDMRIPVQVYPASRQASSAGSSTSEIDSEDALVSCLQDAGVDCVLLAGYLKLVPAVVVAAFRRRMLNIHPGLLPAFGGQGMYGKRVHRAVIASGARCDTRQRTVHGTCWGRPPCAACNSSAPT